MRVSTVNLAVGTTYWTVGVYDLGAALLERTCRVAAQSFQAASTNPHAEDVQQAVIFLQTTALEVTIITFGLADYQAERLRETFFAQWISPK